MIEINTISEEGTKVIKIVGDVDASSSIQLDNEIQKAVDEGCKKILFDCEELNYISSAGLGVFMSYIQHFNENQIKTGLFGLSDKVKNVFQILGLDQLLYIGKTKDEAKSYVDEL